MLSFLELLKDNNQILNTFNSACNITAEAEEGIHSDKDIREILRINDEHYAGF